MCVCVCVCVCVAHIYFTQIIKMLSMDVESLLVIINSTNIKNIYLSIYLSIYLMENLSVVFFLLKYYILGKIDFGK